MARRSIRESVLSPGRGGRGTGDRGQTSVCGPIHLLLLLTCVASCLADAVVQTVPHDYRICVRWHVEGGGLPSSDVQRCFDEPFELGKGSDGHRGFLSPGVHTLTITMEAPQDSYRGGAGEARLPVVLARGAARAVYDDAHGGVAVPLVAWRAPPPGAAVVAGVRVHDNGICEEAFYGGLAHVRGGGPLPADVAARFRDGNAAIAKARMSMTAAYNGIVAPELMLHRVRPGEIRVQAAGLIAMGPGPPPPGAVLPDSWEGFVARDGESHEAALRRSCDAFRAAFVAPPVGGGGDGTCEKALAAMGFVSARAGGAGYFMRALRPDARAVSGTSYQRVNAIGYWDEVDALEAWLHPLRATVRDGGTGDGVVSIARMLSVLDATLAAHTGVARPTLCEVGVDSGYSSLLWLLGAPHARVVAFDLGGHTPEWAGRYLARRFPGRYTLVLGDSVETLPVYGGRHPLACDLWFVDGGHTARVAAADMAAARALSAPGATIIFDDVHSAFSAPADLWLALIEAGAVRPAAPNETIGGSTPLRRPRDGVVIPGSAAGYQEAVGWFA
jgi:hypothetical protein